MALSESYWPLSYIQQIRLAHSRGRAKTYARLDAVLSTHLHIPYRVRNNSISFLHQLAVSPISTTIFLSTLLTHLHPRAAILLGRLDKSYGEASVRQRDVLLHGTPRYENGAISHRESVAELWSDFTYMAPPFLALSAFYARDAELFEEIVRQCHLQEQVLQDDLSRLWRHVIGPEHQDEGLWSTGNGWAACGLVRVFALLQKFALLRPNGSLDAFKESLGRSIMEILRAAVSSKPDENGLLRKYLNDEASFGEFAGTAAIASAIFRLASLKPSAITVDQIIWGEHILEILLKSVAKDGTVSPVVNPMSPQKGSAEGQSFALEIIAAHREWKRLQGTSSL